MSPSRKFSSGGELVAVLDMGAPPSGSLVGEIGPERHVRIIEEASRRVLLGRDTFSSGIIRAQTADAALAVFQVFRRLIDGYAVR
jgi:exopolyphosphatase/pppGpp-phosphohydrolase